MQAVDWKPRKTSQPWGSGICNVFIVHQIVHVDQILPLTILYYTAFRQVPLASVAKILYNFHTRRPLNAHANTHTPKAYAANTPIARPSEANIVRIDRFTAPVITLACHSKHTSSPKR